MLGNGTTGAIMGGGSYTRADGSIAPHIKENITRENPLPPSATQTEGDNTSYRGRDDRHEITACCSLGPHG
jgi:hypothetical protein